MTQAMGVPAGYHSVQPYLIFEDSTKAMAFLTAVFGAAEKLCMKTPEGRVQHAEMAIGDSVVMMADENASMGAFAPGHYKGSPISLMVYVPDCDATYAKALAEGATSLRQPTDQPYGDRMAGVVDPFGYKWWMAQPIVNEVQA